MTMTYEEIINAEQALSILAIRGYKSQKISRKVARALIWAKGKREEFEEARKVLVEGHSMKGEDGKPLHERVQDAETGEWRDDFNRVRLEDPEAFTKEAQKLIQTPIDANGLKFTESELLQCNTPPEPNIYVGLGPMLEWDESEE